MTNFETHPDRYLHWKLTVEGPIARLLMDVDPDRPHRPGYQLKLNSYDLGVDIELNDAIQRLRFEQPQVRVLVVGSANPRIFCAGANIFMLATSSHPHKVNFCKFTNETRCALEDASAHSGLKSIAAVNGTASGGGYELAIACDEILMVDDGNSAVSLPEVPLLGVLPGTGGLTRLVDKRKVRRDLADVFSTLAEGAKAKKAVEWGLIDAAFPRTRFDSAVSERAAKLAADTSAHIAKPLPGKHQAAGITLTPLAPQASDSGLQYRYVTVDIDAAHRRATLTVAGPDQPAPKTVDELHRQGDQTWSLRAFRELEDALFHLRFDYEDVGLVLLKSQGDLDRAVGHGDFLAAHRTDWLANEIVLLMARVLRRLDVTARSLFAIVEPGSCFGGALLEVALAADRIYMLNERGKPAHLAFDALNGGLLPMGHGITRLQSRFLAKPEHAARLAKERPKLDAAQALEQGMVTSAPDEIDWDDEVRVAIEERCSLSPDALTGMEASLRFGGPETMDSKIYGRLSAWQNWIFIRPNAVGDSGALKLYGQPDRPKFDWRRT
jgi:benzoyl-CoA-dihydrodiol lyase